MHAVQPPTRARVRPASGPLPSPSEGWRFRLLLASLVGLLLAYPYASHDLADAVLLHGISALVLVAGVLAAGANGAAFGLACALAIAAAGTDAANVVRASRNLEAASLAFEAAFHLWITALVFREVFGARRVGVDTLAGAACVYLLLGMAFAACFAWLETVSPGSFAIPEGQGKTPPWADLLYASFVTLTTLGYGDVTPESGPARSLEILESVVGVLYVAVLVARLVSLYEAERPGSEPSSDAQPTR